MNGYFIAAAVVTFLTGLAHSVFGERMIFKHLRITAAIPTHGGNLLREHQVRILWASWHLVTLMGWYAAGVLLWLAYPAQAALAGSLIAKAVFVLMIACSALVCVATRGRHPGWIALLATAVLTGLGM